MSRKIDIEGLQDFTDVFAALLAFAKASDESLTRMGRGVDTMVMGYDVLVASENWVKLLRRTCQYAALDEIARMAQEDGFYT